MSSHSHIRKGFSSQKRFFLVFFLSCRIQSWGPNTHMTLHFRVAFSETLPCYLSASLRKWKELKNTKRKKKSQKQDYCGYSKYFISSHQITWNTSTQFYWHIPNLAVSGPEEKQDWILEASMKTFICLYFPLWNYWSLMKMRKNLVPYPTKKKIA